MKYTKHIGYGVLLGASVMMAAAMTVKADENEQTPIPVEEQTTLEPETVSEETLAIEEEPVIEEIESINEPVLTAEKTVVDNGIPVLYLNIDESRGTIDAMNSDFEHNTSCYGTMDFKLPSPDFEYVDYQNELKEYTGLEMSIKGRGHTTWTADKKPYKIKLDKKTDLLGLGEDERNKHWVLLANYADPTLIKNRLTASLGEDIDMEFTPFGVPVDVVMNDTYLGSYLLMEHVRVGKGRIDIDELDENDVTEPEITGGYLVEYGTQTSSRNPGYFTTKSGAEWNNHTPSFNPDDGDYENDVQKNYIRDYFQMIEDMLMSDSQKDENGNSYTAYMDPVSAAKYWLVQNVCNNVDAFRTGSTYLYKKRDGMLYWGPLWDFDQAWEFPYSDDDDTSYKEFVISKNPWIIPMLYDKSEGSIYQHILQEWPIIRDVLLDYIKDDGLIDQFYEETKASQAENAKLYPTENSKPYKEWTDRLKTWINNRIGWMDEHMSDLSEISRKITLKAEGSPDQTYYRINKSTLFFLQDPAREGYIFRGWYDQNGNKVTDADIISSDMVLTAKFVTEEEATKYEEIIFRRDIETIVLSSSPYTFRPDYTGFPENPELKTLFWTSSDESIAAVADENGRVKVFKPGKVTITVTVPNGTSYSYILNIIEDKILPASVTVTENIELQPGEHKRIDFITDPVEACIDSVYFTTMDDTTIAVSLRTGVVTGLEEGTAQVKVRITSYDKPDNIVFEKICIVTVKKKEEHQEIPSESEASEIEQIYSYSNYTSKGVPTGIHTNVKGWSTFSFVSLLAIGYLIKKKRATGSGNMK